MDGIANLPSHDASDTRNVAGVLLFPAVLSLIAGSADVISFLGLDGLFNAHITGNLVIIAEATDIFGRKSCGVLNVQLTGEIRDILLFCSHRPHAAAETHAFLQLFS